MPEIPYKKLIKTLKASEKEELPQVWLIHGEEFLYKGALDAAVDFLVPESSRTLNYDPMDGGNENVPKALERVNTFSMIPGIKVVALRDSRIFYSKEDKSGLLEKAKSAVEKNELRKASSYFISLLSMLNLKFEDLEEDKRAKQLGADVKDELAWVDKVLEYCAKNDLSVSSVQSDMAGAIIEAMQKGFPSGHFLMITSDTTSKAHRLYKAIKKDGMIVDCSVPKGERKADKDRQEAVLNERMRAVLSKAGKTMEPSAYRTMIDMIGFDIRAFVNNLEKLVNYTGEREKIAVEDVQNVVKRTRRDPIFEFTNAVTDRNLQASLFLMDSMLSAGTHPLQLLTAIVNQMRRLILAKDFAASPAGAAWHEGTSYANFQKSVMPALIEFDRELAERIGFWEEQLTADASGGGKKSPGKKKAKKKVAGQSDLVVVKNPKSPFPVFQTIKKSDKFTLEELKDAFGVLANADSMMKSTAQDPKRILENILFKICGGL